jgi:acetyl esterase/lipase
MTETLPDVLQHQFARFAEVHAELPPPRPRQDYPGVTSYYDLVYAEIIGFRPLVLDLHIPAANGPVPVVVWVHGGGWQAGSRAMGHAIELVRHGYAVAAPQYRLSGEAKFPSQVHDLKGAIRWLRANARTYALDGHRVAGWGASAGAFLISLVALADLEGDVGGNLDQSSQLQAVVNYFMVSDLEAAATLTGDTITDQMATNLLGYRVHDRPGAARAASPISHVHKQAPPFLVMHGEADPLVPPGQSEAFHAALSAVGAASQFVVLPGALHEDAAFWSDETLRQVRGFLDRTL